MEVRGAMAGLTHPWLPVNSAPDGQLVMAEIVGLLSTTGRPGLFSDLGCCSCDDLGIEKAH